MTELRKVDDFSNYEIEKLTTFEKLLLTELRILDNTLTKINDNLETNVSGYGEFLLKRSITDVLHEIKTIQEYK
jgi:hypothetical protein